MIRVFDSPFIRLESPVGPHKVRFGPNGLCTTVLHERPEMPFGHFRTTGKRSAPRVPRALQAEPNKRQSCSRYPPFSTSTTKPQTSSWCFSVILRALYVGNSSCLAIKPIQMKSHSTHSRILTVSRMGIPCPKKTCLFLFTPHRVSFPHHAPPILRIQTFCPCHFLRAAMPTWASLTGLRHVFLGRSCFGRTRLHPIWNIC